MELPDSGRVVRHGTADSTNERAFAALSDGTARHGDTHVATFQTAGRGRLGRDWIAPEGESLLASLILLPPAPGPPSVAITMATCLAIRDAVHELGVTRARLKWPNDILVGDAKLCGILVETRGFDPGTPHFVVGLGMNIRQKEFPAELLAERAVTSLALEGFEVEVEAALDHVLRAMSRRLRSIERTDALARDYREGLRLEDAVRVRSSNGDMRGTLVELSVERGVELRTDARDVTIPLELVHGIEAVE